MNREIMEAIVASMNTAAKNDMVVYEYYQVFSRFATYDIEGLSFYIRNGVIYDNTNRRYYLAEELERATLICPICGQWEYATTMVTPVVKVGISGNSIMLDDGMTGMTFDGKPAAGLHCPHCDVPLMKKSVVIDEVCDSGLVHPLCPPPTPDTIIWTLKNDLYDIYRAGIADEAEVSAEEMSFEIVVAKYSGFIKLYGIEDALQKALKEGVDEWYAANAISI